MGKVYEQIDGTMADWVRQQRIFFVATAPLAAGGLVNCSPKGLDTLRILSPNQLAWLDVGGSGIETVAHLKENGRIVIMLCAFQERPRIVRFHGTGEVIERNHPDFSDLLASFPAPPVCRAIIRVKISRILEYRGERDDIARAVAGMTREQLRAQALRQNSRSIEGLAGLDPAALADVGGE